MDHFFCCHDLRSAPAAYVRGSCVRGSGGRPDPPYHLPRLTGGGFGPLPYYFPFMAASAALFVVSYMIYIFLAVFVFAFLVSFLNRKYGSPYTLTFVFGKKGSGKSCLLVHELKRYQKKGWAVYTDMTDCLLPGVRIINTAGLKNFIPQENSFLALDEAGITFDNRNFKSFDAGFRDFFKLQRHYKVRVMMNSQSFDVDTKIRSLVDGMILQSKWFSCISVSRPILRTVALTEPGQGHDSKIADRLKFAPIWNWRFYWMPKYFKYFDSFTAPHREPIAYSEIKPTEQLKTIRRFWHKKRD